MTSTLHAISPDVSISVRVEADLMLSASFESELPLGPMMAEQWMLGHSDYGYWIQWSAGAPSADGSRRLSWVAVGER